MKRIVAICLLTLLLSVPPPLFADVASVYRDTNRFTYGFQRVIMAPFRIPLSALRGTMSGPPIVGTLSGVFTGTFQTVGDVVGGAFDMAASAVPYAKYGLFFI